MNVRMMRTQTKFIFWKRRTEIFLQPSSNDKKTYMKTDTGLLI